MYRLGRAAVGMVAVALIGLGLQPALAANERTMTSELMAATSPCGDITGDLTGIKCIVKKSPKHQKTGSQKGRGGSKTGGVSTQPVVSAACKPRLVSPQPPKSDPIWLGHKDGAIWMYPCWELPQMGSKQFWQAANQKPAAPKVTPAQLAQQAVATLLLPKPGVHRSPPETNSDAGVPYTWVNLWTWYWTTPGTWQVRSKTAAVPGVSVTVQVTPKKLTFDPGDGSAAVACAGPGRPWTSTDADTAPTNGGCAYSYKHVNDSVRATVSIQWAVSWTGTGGATGTLPDLTTTSVSPQFKVEQIQVVNVQR